MCDNEEFEHDEFEDDVYIREVERIAEKIKNSCTPENLKDTASYIQDALKYINKCNEYPNGYDILTEACHYISGHRWPEYYADQYDLLVLNDDTGEYLYLDRASPNRVLWGQFEQSVLSD